MKLNKFLISIIYVLVFIIIICFIFHIKNRYSIKFENSVNIEKISDNKQEENYIEIQEIANKNAVNEHGTIDTESIQQVEQAIIQENSSIPTREPIEQERKQEKNTIKEQVKKEIKVQTQKTEINVPVETKIQENISQVQAQTEVKAQVTEKTPKAEEIKTQDKTESKEEKSNNIVKSNTNAQLKEKEEKYIRNDVMINKIKSVINSNSSEYMQKNGYEIVVDSSIKEHCNQFTFTEARVKSYIAYRFGKIKIYAEDYYKNGQLIMTECYIY